MRVRAPLSVIRKMDAEVDYSKRKYGNKAADDLEDQLFKTLQRLKTTLIGHRFHDELPSCYRVNVKSLALFYYRNGEQGYVLIYSIRGGRQKPMQPRTHKALLTKAEHDNIEL